MVMSALELEILLHFHYSPEPYQGESPEQRNKIVSLAHKNLIKPVGGISRTSGLPPVTEYFYEITDRGLHHVKQLLNTPLPVNKNVWTTASGEIIE